MKRFLITTADERSWVFDRPVLFLGEWCRLYERRHVWETMDAIVARPYGLEPSLKERNREYVRTLTDQLLKEVTAALNGVHCTRHDSRYWQMVVGHWLRRYVATLFNRYHSVEQVLSEQDLAGGIVFDAPQYELATADSISLVWALGDSTWNHVLYSRIFKFLGVERQQSAPEILDGIRSFTVKTVSKIERAINFKQGLRSAVTGLLSAMARKKDAFIIHSYLPRLQELRLQISLGQVPQVWRSPKPREVLFNRSVRQRLDIETAGHKGFELFVRCQLPEMIPVCYLEGYATLVEQVNLLPWPSEPKFIFTSNSFEFDEVFAVWAATMAEKGVPYFTGQHGNNYGTYAGLQDLPELLTCEKFFTWGWTNGNPKNVPAFVFTIAGRKPKKNNGQGGLLLVEHVAPPRWWPEDSYISFGAYQEDQFRFVEVLPEKIQMRLTVRLHPGSESFAWSDRRRWQDRKPEVRIDFGAVKIERLIRRSRLVVFAYDSTGLLESLALNRPTMCFWRGGLDHLLPEAKTYYELLRNVGILWDTPEEAAAKVAACWDDIEEWWENGELQSAREMFCAQYARTVKNPVKTLKQLLTAHTLARPAN